MKNWKTTLFGFIAATLMTLSGSGVKIGHVGSGDWLNTILSPLAIAVAACYQKDKNVTGGTKQQ